MLKFSSFVLILIFTTSLIAQTAVAPSAGDGTENDPYQIESLENLYWIAADDDVIPDPDQETRWQSHYIQTADIDATDTENWFTGEGWKPIGFNGISFSGHYDGGNHIIDQLYINAPELNFVGLFGFTSNATLENIGLTDVSINGDVNVGSLAGRAGITTINNCYSTGQVTAQGNWNVGGLVGRSFVSTVTDSYSECEVNGYLEVGGLIGSGGNSIINCYSIGDVNGEKYVGGLSGSFSGSIENSYSTGDVTASDRAYGGLVGYISVAITVLNSYYDYEEVLVNGENVITIGALDNDMFDEWMNNGLSLDIDDYLQYEGGNYLINTTDDLKRLLAFGQFSEYSYMLTSDLDLAGNANFYIPYFRGTFEGGGYQIHNINIDMSGYAILGLFGLVSEAQIQNVNVVNANIHGSGNIGGLAGINFYSTLTNNSSSGEFSGFDNIGGLAGNNYSLGHPDKNSIIETSYSKGIVNGSQNVGGLVGKNDDEINNCFSTAVVSGTNFVGGLVGFNYTFTWPLSTHFHKSDVYDINYYAVNKSDNLSSDFDRDDYGASISNSFSIGSVNGEEDGVGGLVGYQSLPSVTDSYWDTETSGQTTSAGGEGRTTDEMTYPYADNTYVDWNFETIWAADEDHTVNYGYPYLQDTPLVSAEDDFVISQSEVVIYNYPNPFNPVTTIEFELPQESDVTLEIFNIRGQKVRNLYDCYSAPGIYSLYWNGKDDDGRQLPSGIYLYKLVTEYEVVTRKMMLLK